MHLPFFVKRTIQCHDAGFIYKALANPYFPSGTGIAMMLPTLYFWRLGLMELTPLICMIYWLASIVSVG